MAGRGGRGAALLQALEQPTRLPGQPQSGQGAGGHQPPTQQPYQQQQPVNQQPPHQQYQQPPPQQYQQPPYQQPPQQQSYKQQQQQPPHQQPPHQQLPQQQYQQPPHQQPSRQQYQQPSYQQPPRQQYQQPPHQQPPRQQYQQPPQQQYQQPPHQQPPRQQYQQPPRQQYQQPPHQQPSQQQYQQPPHQQPSRQQYQQPPHQQQPPQQQSEYRQLPPHQQPPPQQQSEYRQQQQQPPYQQPQTPREPYQQPQHKASQQSYQQPTQQHGSDHRQGQQFQGARDPQQGTAYSQPPRMPVSQATQNYGRGSNVSRPDSSQGMHVREAPGNQTYSRPPSQPQGPPPPRQTTPPQAGHQAPQQRSPPSQPPPSEAMSKMAITERDDDSLPLQDGKGTSGKKVPLSANYIPIYSPNQAVFQYCISFNPEVDSKQVRYKLVGQHREFIGATKAFDGITLFLPRKLDQEVTELLSEHPFDQSKVTVTITLTRVVPPDDCLQLYNVLFRRIMKILKMNQVGRYFYDPSRPAAIPQHNLELWPGYITAIQNYEGGLMLLCDISHRLLRTDTCLSFIFDMYRKHKERFQDETTKQLVGTIVLTRYNNKTYRIDDIEWDKSPSSTFTSHSGEEMSYVDYYKNAYGIEIKDTQQPLLVHRPKKKEVEQGGRKTLEVICLIPELCSMTGLTDAIRQDFRVMKDISVHTRVGPMQRLEAMKKFIDNVNSTPEALQQLSNWGLKLDNSVLQTEGRQLAPEMIRFGNSSCSAGNEADWGREVVRQNVISAVHLNTWMVMFVKKNQQNAFEFVNTMKQVTQVMGINVSDPQMIEIRDDRTETYLRNIRENLHPRIQMIVIIFPTSRDDRYAAVKKLCCVESPVPSQVINARTISQQNKLRSVTQKIALQINVKLGGTLWGVDIPSKSLMVVGIDVYHDAARGGRSVGAIVCSMNPGLTRWHSKVCFQSPGQELMDGLKMALTSALKEYHKVNNSLPNRIVVFRDGVGDGQLKIVSGYEVQQLSECFALFGETYVPKLTVIVVQKRINTKLFQAEARGPRPKLTNPAPGTILDHTVTRKGRYDFFLVSQHVRQGTVNPTHYIVVHDTSNWKPDILQKLSYKLTHLYYNWPGTVRVPAPCQYAHKLAFQVGQSIHAEPSPDLSDRLFFL